MFFLEKPQKKNVHPVFLLTFLAVISTPQISSAWQFEPATLQSNSAGSDAYMAFCS